MGVGGVELGGPSYPLPSSLFSLPKMLPSHSPGLAPLCSAMNNYQYYVVLTISFHWHREFSNCGSSSKVTYALLHHHLLGIAIPIVLFCLDFTASPFFPSSP